MNKVWIVVVSILGFQFSHADVSIYRTKQEPSLALLKQASLVLIREYEIANRTALMHYSDRENLENTGNRENELDLDSILVKNAYRMASLIESCSIVTAGESSILARIKAVPATQLQDKVISDFVLTIHSDGRDNACKELSDSLRNEAPPASDPKSFSNWLRYQTARFVSANSDRILVIKNLLDLYQK